MTILCARKLKYLKRSKSWVLQVVISFQMDILLRGLPRSLQGNLEANIPLSKRTNNTIAIRNQQAPYNYDLPLRKVMHPTAGAGCGLVVAPFAFRAPVIRCHYRPARKMAWW